MRRWVVVSCLVAGLGFSSSAQTFRENAKLERCFTETSSGQVQTEVRSAVTVPGGTQVLMTLSSPLHTTSARKGSGVYLVTTWPVVENDTVVIPACTRVVGVVEQDQRPGRVKGRAQFRFRFTSLILPNDHVVKIQGGLQSLPGDEKNRTRDAEGTIEPGDQIDRDVYTVAKGVVAGVWRERSQGAAQRPGLGWESEAGWRWARCCSRAATRSAFPKEPKWRWCCSRRS